MKATGIVLAGGEGRRFGADKRFAEVGGVAMLARVAEALSGCCDDLLVVARGDRPPPALAIAHRLVFDDAPGEGPLAALVTALGAATTPWSLVASCDLPLLAPAMAARLLALAAAAGDDADAVVPVFDGTRQVLLAAYHQRCAAPFAARLAEGERRVAAALTSVRVRYVEPDELREADPSLDSFFNVNTPGDLEAAARLAARDPANDPPP